MTKLTSCCFGEGDEENILQISQRDCKDLEQYKREAVGDGERGAGAGGAEPAYTYSGGLLMSSQPSSKSQLFYIYQHTNGSSFYFQGAT